MLLLKKETTFPSVIIMSSSILSWAKAPWQKFQRDKQTLSHQSKVFRRVAFQRQGIKGVVLSIFHWHVPHWKTLLKTVFPHDPHIPPIKKPPPTRVTRHSQSVRSSSKPCDLCGTAKLCREITVVALSTATAANGRRDTGEVEHSGL